MGWRSWVTRYRCFFATTLSRRRGVHAFADVDGKLCGSRQAHRNSGGGRLLFLSLLTKYKGTHKMLAAFPTMHDRYPNTELVMARDGPEGQSLLFAAQSSGVSLVIRSPGYVQGAEVADLRATTLGTT
jgi:glycosyltransferase involved in cell wall biosynthesis